MKSSLGGGRAKSNIRSNRMVSSINHWFWGGGGGSQTQGNLVIGQNSDIITFAAADVEASQVLSSNLFNPTQLWDNGKTIFPYMRSATSPYGEAGSVMIYDEYYGLLNPYDISPATGADTHAVISIVKASDGRYYFTQTRPHATALRITGTVNVADPTSQQVATTLGTNQAYSSLTKLDNGNFLLFSKLEVDANTHRAVSRLSTSGMDTWGSQVDVTQAPGAGFSHYTSLPSRNKVNGRIYTIVSLRVTAGLVWRKDYLMWTPDSGANCGRVWHNHADTFSKDVVSSGVLSTAELDSNFVMFDTGANNKQGHAPVAAMSPSGDPFMLSGDGNGGYVFVYYNGSAFATKVVSPTGLLDGADIGLDPDAQSGPFIKMWAKSSTSIEWIARKTVNISSTDYSKLKLFRTTDAADNVTDVGDMWPSLTQNLYLCSWPDNYYEILNNRPFYCFAVTTTNPSAIYAAKFAYGTTISPDDQTFSTTALSSYGDLSGYVRGYKVSSSTITQTGTTLNSLIDQSSSAQNATTSGSPVLDSAGSPTYVTLDSVNDLISIPTSGLTALNQLFVLAVVQKLTSGGGGFDILSFANTGGANNYFTFQLRNDVGFNRSWLIGTRFGGVAQSTYYGKTQVSSDTNKVVIGLLIDASGYNVELLGKKEYIKFDATGEGVARQDVGKGITSIVGGISNLVIGALVRNTTAFSAGRLSELHMWSTLPSWADRQRAYKKAATDNGITLTDPYI